MKTKLELRLYGLVPYNISGIQRGIQYGHANDAYELRHPDDKVYQDWKKNWKTYMIMNGGTSNDGRVCGGILWEQGSMETYYQTLEENGINVGDFHEPDLNWMMSGIVFVVDERVFNREDYPDYDQYIIDTGDYHNSEVHKSRRAGTLVEDFPEYRETWLDLIGGEKNAFLKDFIKPLRFA